MPHILIESRAVEPGRMSADMAFEVRASSYDEEFRKAMALVPTAHWNPLGQCWELYSSRYAGELLTTLVWSGFRDITITGPWVSSGDTVRYYRHRSGQWISYNPTDAEPPLFISEPENRLDGRPAWTEVEMTAAMPRPGWWNPIDAFAGRPVPSVISWIELAEAAYTDRSTDWHPVLEHKIGDDLSVHQVVALFRVLMYEATGLRLCLRNGHVSERWTEQEKMRLRFRMDELMRSVEDQEFRQMLRTSYDLETFQKVCPLMVDTSSMAA